MLDDQLDCTVAQVYGEWKSVLFQHEAATGEVAISPPIDSFSAFHSSASGQVESKGLALHFVLELVGTTAEETSCAPVNRNDSVPLMVVAATVGRYGKNVLRTGSRSRRSYTWTLVASIRLGGAIVKRRSRH